MKLRTSATLSPETPMALVRKVWFDSTVSLLRRENENQHQTDRPDSFVMKVDADHSRCIEMTYNESTKNHTGDIKTLSSEIVHKISYRCPQSSTLYQRPKKLVEPGDGIWYTNRCLGPCTLETMMKTLNRSRSQCSLHKSLRSCYMAISYSQ
jgi:hypothetical protein